MKARNKSPRVVRLKVLRLLTPRHETQVVAVDAPHMVLKVANWVVQANLAKAKAKVAKAKVAEAA